MAIPPLSPALFYPLNGAVVDLTSALTFEAVYFPLDNADMTAYYLRRRVNGGDYGYWNGSNWSSTTPVSNSESVAPQDNITADVSTSLSNGNTYNWSIASIESGSTVGPFATDFTFVGQGVPVVSGIEPSGITIAASLPLVQWITTGNLQTYYRMVISTTDSGSTPTDIVFDTGVISSANLYAQVTTPLLHGTTYYVWVQVTVTGGQLSAWTKGSAFSVTADITAPSITTTAVNGTKTAPPYVDILVGGTPSDSVVIFRSDGSYVRGASFSNPALLSGTTVTVYDYEVTPGVSYTYTAVIQNETDYSQPTTSTPAVSVTSIAWWEFDPLNVADTQVSAQFIAFNPQVTEQSTGHQVMGQTTQHIVANTMGATDGTGTYETFDPATYAGITALLQSQKTIFISDPFGGGGYYVRFSPTTGATGGSAGTGNLARDVDLHPSTLSGPHHESRVTFISQPKPPT